MVAPMARAAVAAGADGLIIEVHCDPDHALSDGAQSMFPAQFDRLMAELRIIAPAIGRSICLEPVARRGWGSDAIDSDCRWHDGQSHRQSAESSHDQLPVIQPAARPTGAPPIFEKIGIVGLGLIGGSIALAARQLWPTALVIGVDNKDVLETAMRLHAIDVAADDLIVLAEADLVILAAPVRQNIALLARARRERPAAGGRHRHRQHEARRSSRRRGALPPRFTFIGGHPLGGRGAGRPRARAAGSVQRPAVAADADAATDAAGGDAVDEAVGVRAGARRRAARDRRATAHDRLLAFLSHLPQLTASALMQVVGDAVGQDGLALAGRGLADTTRLASSPPDIWRDIAATNADEIGPALDALIALLQDLRRDLPDGDRLDGRLHRRRPLARHAEEVARGFSRARRGSAEASPLRNASDLVGAGAGTSVTTVERSAGKYFLNTSCSTCGVTASMRAPRVRISPGSRPSVLIVCSRRSQ